MKIDDLLEAWQDGNVLAFLRLIRAGETNQTDDAYRMHFGGSLFDAPPWAHPHKVITKGGYSSSAAGAYQFLSRTWDSLVVQYGFTDFSPPNQDLAAIALIAGRKALDHVKKGNIHEAIRLCGKEWASLPGSPYGQPTIKLEKALEVYRQAGGSLSRPADPPSTPKEVKTMGVFAALLPTLLQLIPTLGSLFPGGEVATRNVAAGTAVVKAITEATQAVNLQDAVEKMQSDPVALQAAKEAVHELLPQLTDFGGGIGEARKFAAENESNRYGRILEVVTYAALCFLALANAMSFTAAFLKDDYSQIAAVIQADIGVGLMAFGFFLGSSLSSKRKDEVKGIQ